MNEFSTASAPDAAPGALERLDRRLAAVRDRVRAVSDGDAPGLYLFGRPGTGKTRVVRRTLHALEARAVYHAGHMTPLGLFELLAAHPDGVLVLDDVGDLLRHPVAAQILLAALGPQSGGDGRRVVSYRRTGAEQRVSFGGGVVLISNLTLHPGTANAHQKTLNFMRSATASSALARQSSAKITKC